MHLSHRVTVTVGLVGLVLASLLTSGSGGSQTASQHAVRRPTAPLPGPQTYGPSTGADLASLDQAADVETARQTAIEALNAEQAQALVDQLAAAAQRSLAAVPATPRVVTAPTSGDCYGVNSYAAYIYQRESGCNPGSVNPGGCAGIGQACPGSKMGCGLSDVSCQLAYFEAYALGRYGSWEAAYNFWQSHSWW